MGDRRGKKKHGDPNDIIREVCVSGKLHRLKNFLADTGVENVRSLLHNYSEDGSTALILVSRNGFLDAVKFMVEQCDINFSQTGRVIFDGENIEGAPPLWCASAAGHLSIVSYLISKGAEVNQTTRSNSTPLRAACYDGHLNVVQFLVKHKAEIEIANSHGHTCLMIACYRGHLDVVEYLLRLGAQVNRRSIKGNTALHDSAESGKLSIMKLLLSKGAKMANDSFNQSPLSAAAMTGNEEIVHYLLTEPLFTPEEQANALELLGATLVDKSRDHVKAVKMWHKALQLRHTMNVPKTLQAPEPAFLDTVEVTDPNVCLSLLEDPNHIRMQALVIRQRILGPCHPDTSYCVRYRGALYADGGDFERCILLWMHTLEMQCSLLDPLASTTLNSYISFVELFTYMFHGSHKQLESDNRKNGFGGTVVRMIELGVGQITGHLKSRQEGVSKTETEDADVKKMMVVLLHLLSLVDVIPCLALDSQSPLFHQLMCITYKWVKTGVTDSNGASPLHLACMESSNSMRRVRISYLPNVSVARVLLKVGADSNARDSDGYVPLHFASSGKKVNMALIQALLEGGAHADVCDFLHVNLFDNLKKVEDGREVCPVANTTLKCLAARVVSHCFYPEDYVDVVGKDLEQFIDLH